LQSAGQPFTSPAANLNAVLGSLAGPGSLKAIFKRMPGHRKAYPAGAVGARPAGSGEPHAVEELSVRD
jgi:hypothetical protein